MEELAGAEQAPVLEQLNSVLDFLHSRGFYAAEEALLLEVESRYQLREEVPASPCRAASPASTAPASPAAAPAAPALSPGAAIPLPQPLRRPAAGQRHEAAEEEEQQQEEGEGGEEGGGRAGCIDLQAGLPCGALRAADSMDSAEK